MSNSIAQIMRKQKSFKMDKNHSSATMRGGGGAASTANNGEGVASPYNNYSNHAANYYTQIPDLFELPITVVNNVLYMPKYR